MSTPSFKAKRSRSCYVMSAARLFCGGVSLLLVARHADHGHGEVEPEYHDVEERDEDEQEEAEAARPEERGPRHARLRLGGGGA